MRQRHRPSTSMVREFTKQYLLISIIPVVLFFIFALIGGYIARGHIADLLRRSTDELNADAKAELEALGRLVIRDKARDAARQVALFLSLNPEMTMRDLQQSPRFREIAMQPVGETGYVCLYEAATGTMRLHPNPALIDREMAFLAADIPSWWTIFERSLSGREVSGYYDWIDPDGTVREKYMTMTPASVPLAGKTLMVAATTYIGEFSAPVAAMEKKARSIDVTFRTFFTDQVAVAALIMGLFLFATFSCVYLIGRRTALHYMLPIVSMSRTAEKLGDGQWDVPIAAAMVDRQDEIGVLARSLEFMRRQMQTLIQDLEQRLAELKVTQQSLSESEAHFRGLFDGVPVGLYRTTFDGRIIDANTALVRMLAFPSRDAFLSRKAESIYARPADRSSWKSLIEGSGVRNVYEVEMRRDDGSIIWVENRSRTVRSDDGSIRYIEGSLIDITERKAAQQALHESERRYKTLYEEAEQSKELYRSLLHSSADAIVICDTRLQTTYVSPVFTDLFGWSLDDLRGEPIPFIPASEQDHAAVLMQEVLEKGSLRHGVETKRITREGNLIDVSISISRYEDPNGRPAGLLQILRDISDRKMMEGQLQFAQRMEAIGTLAGGLAHDFNNLMMGILGNISIMMLDIDAESPHAEKLKKIEKLVQSGSKLTHQLLGYARKGKFEVNVFDLNRIVQESADIFGRTRKEVVVHLSLAPDLQPVEVDRSQIEQVLFNLMINAADAMPGGGSLRLSTGQVSASDIGKRPYQVTPGRYVMLDVADNGHGMDADTRDRIFEPFFTTKSMGRGTGLGLASVYGIVKAHAGYIEVASAPGQGSTFTIYLPVSKKTVRQADRGDASIAFGQGTVLVIDDEAMVLEVATEMIARMGYRTLGTRDGDTGVDVFRRHAGSIDLVILDLIMPGTSGSDTFDALRKIDPQIKILLASGYSLDSQAAALMERGCDGFIQKPYSLEDLSKKMAAVINA